MDEKTSKEAMICFVQISAHVHCLCFADSRNTKDVSVLILPRIILCFGKEVKCKEPFIYSDGNGRVLFSLHLNQKRVRVLNVVRV